MVSSSEAVFSMNVDKERGDKKLFWIEMQFKKE
jgi:hypothetical protein